MDTCCGCGDRTVALFPNRPCGQERVKRSGTYPDYVFGEGRPGVGVVRLCLGLCGRVVVGVCVP